ncbi:MAG: hypothetical protein IPG94_22310 [Kineosporiaceae bacterium]|nr:hypothetical protein [Kineosporiaceae bacterium]
MAGAPNFEDILKQAQAQAQQQQGGSATSPQVYMGRSFSPDVPGTRRPQFAGTKQGTASYLPADVAKSKWYLMSQNERDSLAQRMQRAGLISDPRDYDAALKAWNYAVEEASGFTTAGKDMTPWDFLDLVEASGSGNSRGSGTPKKQTATSTRVNLPSKADAEAVVTQILQDALGRDPDKGELARYSSLLIGKAKANPEQTSTTTTYNADGSSSNSSTVTSGGYSSAAMQQDLLNQAKADPEYGSYQAATTYMNAVMSAIDAPA